MEMALELEAPLDMEKTPLDLTEERQFREFGGKQTGRLRRRWYLSDGWPSWFCLQRWRRGRQEKG